MPRNYGEDCKMKIIFFSDIHGKFDRLSALPKADFYIVGGDFTTLGDAEQFRAAVAAVERKCPDFLGIIGNMDCKEGEAILKETGHLLCLNGKTIGGVKLRGFGGGNKSPFNTPVEWNDSDASKLLSTVDAVDIFVCHAPPLNSGADRISSGICVGSSAIAEFIVRVSPKLVLCGHIHEAVGIYQIGETFIVNSGPDGYAEIDWNDGKPEVILRAY